jgi:AmmeMemoRadiSam system protein B
MSELPVRQPAVAGTFYPGSANALRRAVRQYLDAAELPADLGTVRAVIAPHAGYIYSGPTAGYAFKALAALPPKNWTVFLLGPAHRVPVRGVALGHYTAFRTPLGDAPVAVDRVAKMAARSREYILSAEAHAMEHCLEVEVPFLQVVLPEFHLVPMLYGEVDPQQVAQDVAADLGEDDILVISSDLSHYYPYDTAQRLDRSFLQAVLDGDRRDVGRGEACGRAPVVTAMEIARRKGWNPHLLDYRTSGDTAGDRWQVVGYAAVAYTD